MFITIHRETTILKGDECFGQIISTSKFIPHVLLDIGVIKSTGELKRNRPDLWRDYKQNEVVKYGKHRLRLFNTHRVREMEAMYDID